MFDHSTYYFGTDLCYAPTVAVCTRGYGCYAYGTSLPYAPTLCSYDSTVPPYAMILCYDPMLCGT
eukprot:1578609-Rhodomonas_salina.1